MHDNFILESLASGPGNLFLPESESVSFYAVFFVEDRLRLGFTLGDPSFGFYFRVGLRVRRFNSYQLVYKKSKVWNMFQIFKKKKLYTYEH